MIEVIHYQNEQIEKPLVARISDYYDEVRKPLPKLPETVKIYFGNYGIIPESGVGGYAYAHDVITISIEPNFKDKNEQSKNIRATIFHEAFHQYQNYTGQGPRYSAIESAVYEGMATVFEREYAHVLEPYGEYRQASTDDLRKWVEELGKLGPEYFEDETLYRAWKFYHPELKERWIAYRAGTWITDQVLEMQNLTILDLSTMSAADVLRLYNNVKLSAH